MYRGVHSDNDWLRGDVWGMRQVPKRQVVGKARREDAIEAIIANGYESDLLRSQATRTLAQRLKRSFKKRASKLQKLLGSRRQPKD
jgi:hypothetical protein